MATKKVNKINSNEPISQDQEEEMSSALIAQLLAEDNMAHGDGNYYAEYSNDSRGYDPYHTQQDNDDSYDENSEDDFDPKKKKYVSKKDVVKRGRKRKVPPTRTKSEEPEVSETPVKQAMKKEPKEPKQPKSAEPKAPALNHNKKPKKPVQEGCNSGVYNELEEKNFLEGLELFGRDWGKLQKHVATRDSNSIRSHAQKHFIKMFRDQIPLPAKIRESGEGYTLSGKPLDPNSAAAKPYLSRQQHHHHALPKPVKKSDEPSKKEQDDPMQGVELQEQQPMPEEKRSEETGTVVATEKEITEQTVTEGEKTVLEKKEQVNTEQDKNMDMDAITKAVETQTQELKIGDDDKKTMVSSLKEKKTTKSATPSPSNSSTTSDPYDSQGRTNYSTSRLRRQRDQTSVNYGQISKDDDPLTMIKCEPFTGKPGSNTNGCQPFELAVDSNVLLAMDFHAHLMTTEVIGFLAGEWNKEKMQMSIREAFPCRSIETGQNDVNVEMDPASAIEVRQMIEERNLKVVGWYHSHPTFIPDPSLVDIENQRNYQLLCRDNHHHEEMGHVTLEPFVGAIVGPYDPALPGSSSVINWFHVSNTNSDRPVPKKLIYELNENETLGQVETDRLFDLLATYKDSSEKVVFAEHWRQDATESKLQKMIKSLGSRMPWIQKQLKSENLNDFQDLFLNKVQSSLKDW